MRRLDAAGKVVCGIVAGVLLSGTALFGADRKTCTDAGTTQAELNQCAAGRLKAADDELNRVYQAVLGKYRDDRQFLDKLRRAQRAWLAFRDAELEARFPLENKQAHYGSMYPRCENLFLAQRTEARIRELQQWLEGTEEGDVCAGSVRPRGTR